MERFIKVTFVLLVSVLAATGIGLGSSSLAGSGNNVQADEVAFKRDEDDVEAALARGDEDDEDDEWGPDGLLVAAANGDASRSNDRSRDATTADRSNSLDRSRDRTGDRVGALDRSNSLDRSGDRTGDHNSADISNSRDVSQDTSVSNTNNTNNTNDTSTNVSYSADRV